MSEVYLNSRFFSCNFFAFIFFLKSFNVQATVVEDAISPVAKDDARAVLLIGTTVTLVTSLFKNSFVESTQRQLQESKPLCCTVTKAGDNFLQIVPNVLYSIGFGLRYWIEKDEVSKQRSVDMAKSTIYSGLFTDILKPILNETRPNGGKHSFPSGHTTTAFAFAGYIGMEHEWYYSAPAYVMAAFVGFCRMHDNYHFLHDVLAGATIGMSYGIAMGSKAKVGDKSSAFIIIPSDDLKGAKLNFAKSF